MKQPSRGPYLPNTYRTDPYRSNTHLQPHSQRPQPVPNQRPQPVPQRPRSVPRFEDEEKDPVYMEELPEDCAGDQTASATDVGGSAEEDGDVVVIKTTEDKLREAERIIASEVFYKNVVPPSLFWMTSVGGFFQLLQAALLFVVASRHDGVWYWYTSYPEPDGESAMKPTLKEVADFSVLWLVPLIPLLSGIEHMVSLIFRPTYVWYIERHQNVIRWTEYTLSAPLMQVIIAQQVGITDVHLLVAIFVLMALCIQCGAIHENVNAKARSENRPQNWRAFWVSWFGYLVPWCIIFNYFGVFVGRGGTSVAVWAIIFLQFFIGSSFAVLFTLIWAKIGIFEDYVVGEKAFIVLSFAAKTFLVWLTVANALAEDN